MKRWRENPELSRGWSSTYLEVCDLIKAKLVYANKSKALVIWNYYIYTHTHTACWQMPLMKSIISPAKLSKMEGKVMNAGMRSNRGMKDMVTAVAA